MATDLKLESHGLIPRPHATWLDGMGIQHIICKNKRVHLEHKKIFYTKKAAASSKIIQTSYK